MTAGEARPSGSAVAAEQFALEALGWWDGADEAREDHGGERLLHGADRLPVPLERDLAGRKDERRHIALPHVRYRSQELVDLAPVHRTWGFAIAVEALQPRLPGTRGIHVVDEADVEHLLLRRAEDLLSVVSRMLQIEAGDVDVDPKQR